MAQNIQDTAEKIRKLQVQGARNVAIAAVEAIRTLAQQSQTKNKASFIAELKDAQAVLAASRETEPLMRNAMRYLIAQAQNVDTKKIEELSQIVAESAIQFLSDLDTSREHTATAGAKRIRDGSVVFTHCHSSTVTRMLAKAKADGKNFRVICTETRPAFQGRITAKELVGLGIDTTFIVDSAARTFIGEVEILWLWAPTPSPPRATWSTKSAQAASRLLPTKLASRCMWFRNCSSLTPKRSGANAKKLSSATLPKSGARHQRALWCVTPPLTLPPTAT